MSVEVAQEEYSEDQAGIYIICLNEMIFLSPQRMDSSCQLNLHHDIILPSDGAEESLGMVFN